MGTFIDSTLVPFEVISDCNALVVLFQQLLEGPMEVLLCERVNDLRHSLFYLLVSLLTTASKVFLELRKITKNHRDQHLDYREGEGTVLMPILLKLSVTRMELWIGALFSWKSH